MRETDEAVLAVSTIPSSRASARAAAPEQIDNRQQDDGSDQRHDDRRDRDALIDGCDADQRRYQPAREQRANDADDDVEEDALLGRAAL